jgi:hypothetical protein
LKLHLSERVGAGLPVVAAGDSLDPTERSRWPLPYFLCTLPDSAYPEQDPICLKQLIF